nr:DUF3164 family protein [uncultured Capnocytophaga sp.]
MSVDLSQMSAEDLKKLQEQLKEKQRAEKLAKQQSRQALLELEEELVDDNIGFCLSQREDVEDLVAKLFQEAKTIIALRSELYGTQKEEQDSHTFTKADGSASIRIGWNVRPAFNGTESEGLKKIKTYMSSLAGDTEKEKLLLEFLNTALRTDAQGNLNPREVRKLGTLRQKANSALFDEGMEIIENAIVDIRTSMYIRGYKLVKFENGIEKRVNFNFSID